MSKNNRKLWRLADVIFISIGLEKTSKSQIKCGKGLQKISRNNRKLWRLGDRLAACKFFYKFTSFKPIMHCLNFN